MPGFIVNVIAWLDRKLARRSLPDNARLLRAPSPAAGGNTKDPSETLYEGLKRSGYTTYTDFSDIYPRASLAELAVMLGAEPDSDYVVHARLLMEAERRHAVDLFARSLFIRFLYHGLHPEKGLKAFSPIFAPTWTVELALYRVALTLPSKYRAACLRVALGYLRADVGFDWRPESVMDIALVELFCNYWPDTSVSFFPIVRLPHANEPRLPKLHLDEKEKDGREGHDWHDETPPPPAA